MEYKVVYLPFWLMLPLYEEKKGWAGLQTHARSMRDCLGAQLDTLIKKKAWAEAVLKITAHNYFSSYARINLGCFSIDFLVQLLLPREQFLGRSKCLNHSSALKRLLPRHSQNALEVY